MADISESRLMHSTKDGKSASPIIAKHDLNRQTLLGMMGHYLHSLCPSRIGILPTVYASSSHIMEIAEGSPLQMDEIKGDTQDDSPAVTMETNNNNNEDGWVRLKEAFFFNDEDGMSRGLYEVIMMFILGGMLGFVYGGVPASRFARGRYIQNSQASIYHSKLEATGSSYNAASRGMIRYGYRWGWRTALLAGGYHGISTSVAVYRNKQDIVCYTVAGVSTGMLYRVGLGIRGMVGGAFVGGLLGIPCGALLIGFQRMLGETFIEKHRRQKAERQAEKMKERALRMSMTPRMMELMEESLQNSEKLQRDKEQAELSSSLPTQSS